MERISAHITIPAEDWDLLGHAAIRRRTSRAALLLELAGPGLAALRRAERAAVGTEAHQAGA